MNLRNIRNRKKLVPVLGVFLALLIGTVVAQLLLANSVKQEFQLRGIENTMTLSIEQPLPSFNYKGDSLETVIKIQRLNPLFEGTWKEIWIFNNTDGNPLVPGDIVATSELRELDQTTSIIALLPATFIQNTSTSVYVQLGSFSDWSTFVTQGDICYLYLVFSFSVGSVSGNISTTLLIEN